jgi:hypothetical protein
LIASGITPSSQGGDYWTHLLSWWARRNDPDVLFLAFMRQHQDRFDDKLMREPA